MSQWDVIVIGGGFAGLSAATALGDAGKQVLVLEARHALGGRAATYRDPATGEAIDNGQHILAGCYEQTLRFLRRIGSESRLRRSSRLEVAMIDASGAATTLSLPPFPAPMHLLAGVLAWDALGWRERASILRIGPWLRAGAVTNGSALTVRQWLHRHGQSARLCELLWEPLALAALNQSIDQASASAFLTVLSRMFASDASGSALLLPSVFLDRLYAEPSRVFIEKHGGAVRTNAPASLIVDNDRVVAARVRGAIESASVVISAVPWFALRALFEAIPASIEPIVSRADAMQSSPIVTVNLWFDRAVLDRDFVGLPGRRFQWAFDKGRIVAQDTTHLSLVSSGALDMATAANEEVIGVALREVMAALPQAREATVRRASAVRERRATFSLAPGAPARPSTMTAVGGLLLAGDWIETGLPATIESAVVSGHLAAEAAIER